MAFAGTVAWPLNPEAAVVLAVSAGGVHPLAAGLVAAVGQLAAHGVLWSAGAWLRRNWAWFDRQCNRALARFGRHRAHGSLPLVLSSGLLGLPPGSVTAALGPGLGLHPAMVLPMLFLGRVVRFTALGLLAEGVFHTG